MKPAVKTALAFAHICGFLPKNIHLSTWSAANKCFEPHVFPRQIKPEFLDQIADHPFMVGHAKLTAEGFRPRPKPDRTSRTIEYDHSDHDDRAFISRSGGGWYWRRIPGAGYRTETFE